MMRMLSFTSELSESVLKSPYDFVVTGANGWLGRATLEMLYAALGENFYSRVTALGSHRSELVTGEGKTHPVQALSEWQPSSNQPLIIFHYAFLTKDKVNLLSAEDYIARNNAITNTVTAWIASGLVRGVVLPSSGAVYDHLYAKTRDESAGLYGKLKYTDELTFAAACDAKSCSLIIPRVFNLSGPFINKFQSYALASFIVQALQANTITIIAPHPVLRSYYFVGDLIEMCLQLLLKQNMPISECFDVAGDEIVELSSLANLVLKTLAKGDAQPVNRTLTLDNTVEDRYIGSRKRIQELEISLGMHTKSLEHQIKATGMYLIHLLQQ